ncbi:MAG: type II secretion system protein [Candidatus Margulisiibacteriota bacterium]
MIKKLPTPIPKSLITNHQQPTPKAGFTLIELLVVISIIGILAGLTLSSYSGAQKQARDSQRRSDLNQYRNALEVYAGANNLKYPIYSSRTDATTMCSAKLTNMMSSCPNDPQSPTNSYYYISDAAGTQFILWATLETGGYWEVCSSGKTGKLTVAPTDSTCDL